MREGPLLGVAKAARAPPFTLPILGRRFHFHTATELFSINKYSRINHSKNFKQNNLAVSC